MVQLNRREMFIGAGVSALVPASAGGSVRDIREAWLDTLVRDFMERFETPGIAVTIVRPGRPALFRGYGLRTIGRAEPVDEKTIFAIASNSKAMTAAALAILVDDSKIAWDQPVTRYLPDFAMSDPRVTEMMTVRDLLIHSSGLPLGAGDLMWSPPTTKTVADLVHGIRYLPLKTGFREKFAYDNILYVVAGEVIAQVSGLSWRDFVSTHVLQPLGMIDSVPTRSLIRTNNVVSQHSRRGGPVIGTGPMSVVSMADDGKTDPAGGVYCSARDAARWLSVQLSKGLTANGRLWSEGQADAMWTPQTLINDDLFGYAGTPAASALNAYALGWFVQSFRGHKMIYHEGGDIGQVTHHVLLPDLGCGIAVYTNANGRNSFGLRNAILDHLIGTPPYDWLEFEVAKFDEREASLRIAGASSPLARPAGSPSLPLDTYVGRYRDPWYGDVEITRQPTGLRVRFVPTPTLTSVLEAWGPDAFRTRFAPDIGEDAIISFANDGRRVTHVTMRALSPTADFSYDYHDLHLVPVDGTSQ
ncbi:CubicO group peptidase, beta-lactamase class C family [Sphingomonas guangdongensis]|uniref:CubicO group peptidase, beta-lactamase class C family n=1 Tax=Sphingomonas guangdongensis TaxID=1141890 RepID=A0A285QCI3_9SPHN|nr:serine hydrolase [Sphingomonas guangdongensis]SOB79159.1 CubicO group peptidase, beta-lactamase class C family [Sphingomonas guangdongensis]